MSIKKFLHEYRQGDGFRLSAGIIAYHGLFSADDITLAAQELGIDRSQVENLIHAGEVCVKCPWTNGIPDLRPSHLYRAWEWSHYLNNWEEMARLLEDCSAEKVTARDVATACEMEFGARPNRRDYISRDLIPSQIRRRIDDLYSLFERAGGIDAPAREKARGLLRELGKII
jgi:hypothetical protein